MTTACKVLWRGVKLASSGSSEVLPFELERLGIEDAMRKERRLERVWEGGRLLVDTESGVVSVEFLRCMGTLANARCLGNQGNLTSVKSGTPSSCSHFHTK